MDSENVKFIIDKTIELEVYRDYHNKLSQKDAKPKEVFAKVNSIISKIEKRTNKHFVLEDIILGCLKDISVTIEESKYNKRSILSKLNKKVIEISNIIDSSDVAKLIGLKSDIIIVAMDNDFPDDADDEEEEEEETEEEVYEDEEYDD